MTRTNRIDSLRRILTCALLLQLPLLPLGASAADGQRMIVFGDSLSDAGNYHLATDQSVTAPFEPIPVSEETPDPPRLQLLRHSTCSIAGKHAPCGCA